MSRKVWNLISYDKERASRLARECGTDDFAVLLLQSRGIDTPEKINAFLYSSPEGLSSPYLLKDMDYAVNRIRLALDNGEKILVYGDYDADGVTATALLYSYLEASGADVSYYIPSRINEGYGLSANAAEKIADSGYQLVITVDNGIAAIEEAAFFKSRGIDLIVTDHHKVGSELPDAVAVVDPHREDDYSPEKELAGVGVALKLCAALEDGEYSSVLEDFADIAAIGTIADIVPLTGENRIIASAGLSSLENCCRPGLVALIEKLGCADKPITSSTVAFAIAPRINAAGRMDSAYTALELLITDEEERAYELADMINAANTERQGREQEMTSQVEEYLDLQPLRRLDKVIVAAGRGWHPGIIGIVASRLVDRYGRPAIVISVDENGVCRGSGRSIEGFSLYDALSAVSDELIQFGGHTLAAGFSVKEENIEAFREKINAYAASCESVYPSVDIDCRLNPANITADILDSLSLLEPFGAGNPSPTFGLFGMKITGIRSIGGNKHIKLTLSRGKAVISAVRFGQSVDDFPFREGDVIDAAVKIERNDHMGEVLVSIQIKDVRPSGTNESGFFASSELFGDFSAGRPLSDEQKKTLCPDRALISKIYRYVRENGAWKYSSELLCFRLGIDASLSGAVSASLKALVSVGILKEDGEEYTLSDFSGKADLTDCELLKNLGYV